MSELQKILDSDDAVKSPERITIPAKFRCESHVYYSDEKPCPECLKLKTVSLKDLNDKVNLPLACFVDPDTKQRGWVVNSMNVGDLYCMLHELEDVIKMIKNTLIERQKATSIQTAPASVLDKLRG